MITIAIADDQVLLRSSLATLLDSEPDFTVTGEATNGEQVLELARRTSPDVVLMDIRMPGVDGLEATRHICEDPALDTTRVLVLSMFDLDEYVYDALRAGAAGFLLKDTEPSDLIDAIRRIAAGETLLAPSLTRRLINHYLATPTRPPPVNHPLTNRELEVLSLIGSGLANNEVAERLTISTATVKSHVSHLLSKLNARDRVHLVIAAYDLGLVARQPPR